MLSRYRGTIAVAPQFALNLCLRRVRPSQLDGVDLSALRVLLDGAEPVDHDAILRFEKTFSSAGLQPGVVTPCYGLAECTLAVTMGQFGQRPQVRRPPEDPTGATSRDAVSAGRPMAGTTIAIAGQEGELLGEGAVGEILVRSPSVCRGQLTEGGIAELAEGGWLRTGDLGFLSGGELYVSGRAKDTIISAGRNVYPQHLEQLIADVPGLRMGRAVAFAATDAVLGTESVVVAAETRLTAWTSMSSAWRRSGGDCSPAPVSYLGTWYCWVRGQSPRPAAESSVATRSRRRTRLATWPTSGTHSGVT